MRRPRSMPRRGNSPAARPWSFRRLRPRWPPARRRGLRRELQRLLQPTSPKTSWIKSTSVLSRALVRFFRTRVPNSQMTARTPTSSRRNLLRVRLLGILKRGNLLQVRHREPQRILKRSSLGGNSLRQRKLTKLTKRSSLVLAPKFWTRLPKRSKRGNLLRTSSVGTGAGETLHRVAALRQHLASSRMVARLTP